MRAVAATLSEPPRIVDRAGRPAACENCPTGLPINPTAKAPNRVPEGNAGHMLPLSSKRMALTIRLLSRSRCLVTVRLGRSRIAVTGVVTSGQRKAHYVMRLNDFNTPVSISNDGIGVFFLIAGALVKAHICPQLSMSVYDVIEHLK